MNGRTKEGLARLVIALALNLPLYFVLRRVPLWSGVESEVRNVLIGGSLAVGVIVCVVPVFRRCPAWQAPIAFVLAFFLPGPALVAVIYAFCKYW